MQELPLVPPVMTGNLRTVGCVERAAIPEKNKLQVKYEGLTGGNRNRAQEALWRAYLSTQFGDSLFDWLVAQPPAKAKKFWDVGPYGVKKVSLAANFGGFSETNVNKASEAVERVVQVFTGKPLLVRGGNVTRYNQRQNALDLAKSVYIEGAIPSMASKEVLSAIAKVVSPETRALATWLRKRMDFAYDCIVTNEQV
jgi:hypothetical protein